MHWDWNAVLSVVVAAAAMVLRWTLVTPRAHDIALKIRHLADDAAAVVLATNPNAPWAAKLKAVMDQLDALIPNIDPSVIERAATGALMRLSSTSPPATIVTTGTGTGAPTP